MQTGLCQYHRCYAIVQYCLDHYIIIILKISSAISWRLSESHRRKYYKYLGRSIRLVLLSSNSIGDKNWTVKWLKMAAAELRYVMFTNHRQTCVFCSAVQYNSTKYDQWETFYILSFAQSWLGLIMSTMQSDGVLHKNFPFYLARVGVSKVASHHTIQFSTNAVTIFIKRQLKSNSSSLAKRYQWKHRFSINLKKNAFCQK